MWIFTISCHWKFSVKKKKNQKREFFYLFQQSSYLSVSFFRFVCQNLIGGKVTLVEIARKVCLESLCWGIGTAIGELPPYFVARGGKNKEEEEGRESLV